MQIIEHLHDFVLLFYLKPNSLLRIFLLVYCVFFYILSKFSIAFLSLELIYYLYLLFIYIIYLYLENIY